MRSLAALWQRQQQQGWEELALKEHMCKCTVLRVIRLFWRSFCNAELQYRMAPLDWDMFGSDGTRCSACISEIPVAAGRLLASRAVP